MRQHGTHNAPARGRANGLILATVCAVAALAAACSRPASVVRPETTPAGQTLARVTSPGATRVELERDKQTPAWDAVAMRNAGSGPIRQIRLWGMGRRSLLTLPGSRLALEEVYSPFALLPGEEFALTAPPANPGELYGLLHWISPADPKLLQGCFMRASRSGVQILPSGAIVLAPGAGEAWVQMELSAPLTYQSVRIAWEADPAPFEPQLWYNLDGDVWARLPLAQRVDWLHPADITKSVAGARRFWIRLVYEVPAARSKEPGQGSGPAPEAVTIRRLRIDREIQGPGKLRTWKNGKNAFDIELKGEAPELEILLGGKKQDR